MELSWSNIKKTSYIFSKESFSYISGNKNPEKFLYISGNKRPEKILDISRSNFPSSKVKRTLSEKASFISRNGTFLYICYLAPIHYS